MLEIATNPPLRRAYFRWERALLELLPDPGWRVMAAISGGCDSVVLAWLLHESARRGLGTVALGHVNHGLRAEATREETFVRRLADSWGLTLHVETVNPAALAAAKGWSIEQAARALRLRALAKLCRAAKCGAVALGHQMDDQAETVLLRILRGTGPRGLGVMEPRTTQLTAASRHASGESLTLIRPLLGFRRREIRELAVAAELEWVEDPTNEDPRFLRNRIRRELIPQLQATYNPRLVESLAELARWQRMESEPVAKAAKHAKQRVARCEFPPETGVEEEKVKQTPTPRAARRVVLDAAGLAQEADAVATRVLWLAYQDLAGPEGVLGGRHTAELLDLVRRAPGDPEAEVHLPGRIRARSEQGRILLEYHEPRPEKHR